MKQGLDGQTRAQMMGDFMNICIGLQVMIVSSANQSFFLLAIVFQKAKLKFKTLKMK
jgi:imidazoleglycerol phosphate synthase glutamine amidotransferase subunit HisH